MRRRFFGPRRPFRRFLIPDIPPALNRAHELMATGNYQAAAQTFEQLARGAEARGGPRAAQIYLQAGRAYILANQVELGMKHLKHGLGQLASHGQWSVLQRTGDRAVAELNQLNLTSQAQEISSFLKTILPAQKESPHSIPAKRPVLPTHCPGCGGPLRPDEVEWLDEVTAECGYCGSPIRGDG